MDATLEPDSTEPETLVIFRRFRDGLDPIALFPLIPGARVGSCQSYQRIGQHGEADLALTRETYPTSGFEPDVQALKRELERIGYRLRVGQRLPHWRAIRASREAVRS